MQQNVLQPLANIDNLEWQNGIEIKFKTDELER